MKKRTKKLKILVVDDKKVIGDLFEFTLGFSGHMITFVDNGKTAFETIQKKKFDIAFIDIVMPAIDGIEIFNRIKSVAPDLPIVMMSGYAVEDKRKKARDLGARAILDKPFEIDEVKNIIKDVFEVDI